MRVLGPSLDAGRGSVPSGHAEQPDRYRVPLPVRRTCERRRARDRHLSGMRAGWRGRVWENYVHRQRVPGPQARPGAPEDPRFITVEPVARLARAQVLALRADGEATVSATTADVRSRGLLPMRTDAYHLAEQVP